MKDDRTGQDVAGASLEARAEALGRAIIDKLGPLAPAPPRYFRDTCIDLVRAVDASRPGLSEEQADAIARSACGGLARTPQALAIIAAVKAALLRASRGETGPDEQAARVAAAAKAGWTLDPATRRWTGPSPSDPAILADVAAWEADVAAQQRVAAPTWGEQAIEEHRRAAQPEPFEKIEQLPSGLTCPGCYAATGIAQPHDPRATLHDGDPQKSGTLAGDDSGDD